MKVDAIDPFTYKTSEIKLAGDHISPRYSHNFCKISSCKALLYGGIGKRKVPCGDAFIVDFDDQTVTRVLKPPIAVGSVSSALVEETVYFFGGWTRGGTITRSSTMTWSTGSGASAL